MSNLTAVDKFIKYSMLAYPTVNPTRWKTLRHIFFVNGNGMDWDNTGDIPVIYDIDENISYSNNSLETLDEWIEDRADIANVIPESTLEVEKQMQIAMQKIIEDNIDILCKQNCSSLITWLPKPQFDDIKYYSRNFNLINDALKRKESDTSWTIKVHWKAPTIEAINMWKHLWWNEFGIHGNGYDLTDLRAWKTEKAFEEYMHMSSAVYILFPEEKELDERRNKIANEIIEKILEEKNRNK